MLLDTLLGVRWYYACSAHCCVTALSRFCNPDLPPHTSFCPACRHNLLLLQKTALWGSEYLPCCLLVGSTAKFDTTCALAVGGGSTVGAKVGYEFRSVLSHQRISSACPLNPLRRVHSSTIGSVQLGDTVLATRERVRQSVSAQNIETKVHLPHRAEE